MAYPISYRLLEEMMKERGVSMDHSTLHRWGLKDAPEIEKKCRARTRPMDTSRRLAESYGTEGGGGRF